MAKPGQTRRQFVLALGAFLALFVMLGRFLRPRLPLKKVLLSIAKAEIPQHGALVYRDSRVAVIRDGAAFYALSLTCTHLGCTVAVTATGLACPCHGSTFDRQGQVLSGPAGRSLDRYTVEDQGDRLVVLI